MGRPFGALGGLTHGDDRDALRAADGRQMPTAAPLTIASTLQAAAQPGGAGGLAPQVAGGAARASAISAIVGPREYDWLGPLCFLAAGDASRVDAFFDGYHRRAFDRSRRETLLRLLLLHRYSNLKAQITVPGWQAAPDFATLAALIWP